MPGHGQCNVEVCPRSRPMQCRSAPQVTANALTECAPGHAQCNGRKCAPSHGMPYRREPQVTANAMPECNPGHIQCHVGVYPRSRPMQYWNVPGHGLYHAGERVCKVTACTMLERVCVRSWPVPCCRDIVPGHGLYHAVERVCRVTASAYYVESVPQVMASAYEV